MPDEFDDWLSRSLAEGLGTADTVPPLPRYRESAGRPGRRILVWWPVTRAGLGALLLGSALLTGSIAAGFHAINPSASLPILGGGQSSAHPGATPSGVHGGPIPGGGTRSTHGRSSSASGHSPSATSTSGHGRSSSAPGRSPSATSTSGHGRSGSAPGHSPSATSSSGHGRSSSAPGHSPSTGGSSGPGRSGSAVRQSPSPTSGSGHGRSGGGSGKTAG
jgi:hypothetical protein